VCPSPCLFPGLLLLLLLCSGAFMTSTMRLTIAIAVIMVEISDDVHMLLPVLVAVMVAKWVADAATHSIYHTLLEVKCVPFLVHEPASKFSLDLLPISTVMRSPVVCLELHMKVREGRARSTRGALAAAAAAECSSGR
jgi:chloride channel 7